MNEPTITHATITPMPKNMFDEMPKVIATFSNGEVKTIFSFYPDEISFRENEFIGLTERQAVNLKYKKDLKYLQS
jgi:hypothetical protein